MPYVNRKATVPYAFSGSSVSGGMSVEKGEVVLRKKPSEEWCHCIWDGEQGYVPSSYCKLERNSSPSSPKQQHTSPQLHSGASPSRCAVGASPHGCAAPTSEDATAHARASHFAEFLHGAQATACGLSPVALARGTGSPAAPVTPTHRSPLGRGARPEDASDDGDSGTLSERVGASMRRTSTASTRSAALTNAWLTGRVRGSASLQCAADVLASTTDFWLGSGGMDAGNDATGQIGGSFPLQQQQQLVWAASGNFGRSSRVPCGRGGGRPRGSTSVDAAVNLMMTAPLATLEARVRGCILAS